MPNMAGVDSLLPEDFFPIVAFGVEDDVAEVVVETDRVGEAR